MQITFENYEKFITWKKENENFIIYHVHHRKDDMLIEYTDDPSNIPIEFRGSYNDKPSEIELLGQSVSEREIQEIIQGQQISDLEIRLLIGGL